MATFTVTTLADGGAGSLRAALAQANATAAADTVVFAPGLEGGTVTLSRGQLDINSDVTIDGDRNGDGREVQLVGGGEDRVLAVGGMGTDARLVDLTISGGYAVSGTGAGGAVSLGAGQALRVEGCTLTDNIALYGRGGAIFADDGARLGVAASTISGNFAGTGGGIYLSQGCAAVITTSRITDNGAATSPSSGDDPGGGIYARDASLVLTRGTVDGNRADVGAGISAQGGRLTVDTSTIAGNDTTGSIFGGSAAGVSVSGDGYAFLANTTVTDNRIARYGPGPDTSAGIGVGASATLVLANTIVAGNDEVVFGEAPAASDIGGTIDRSNGHNVFGSDVAGSVAGDVEGSYSGTRGGLGERGGPTPTIVPGEASLSRGEPVAAGTVDQRGFLRPVPADSNPDTGAFESAVQVSRAPTAGNDAVTGTAGADTLNGLAGGDLVLGRGGNDALNGGADGDTLRGGFGADRLDGDTGQDTASYRDATGAVTASLAAGTATGAAGTDTLRELENLEGGSGADRLTGSALANWLGGLDGDDRLFGLGGFDVLRGGSGADRLTGGHGRDRLEGGAGGDVFDFDRLTDSTVGAPDFVADLSRSADRIDLATIDARAGTPGTNDAFTFLAGQGTAFTGAGQVRWFRDDGGTVVEASVDADAAAELRVEIAGPTTLAAGDFVL